MDEAARTVMAEPAVTIGQLNDYLIEKGWTLPVLLEIDNLTIGDGDDLMMKIVMMMISRRKTIITMMIIMMMQ